MGGWAPQILPRSPCTHTGRRPFAWAVHFILRLAHTALWSWTPRVYFSLPACRDRIAGTGHSLWIKADRGWRRCISLCCWECMRYYHLPLKFLALAGDSHSPVGCGRPWRQRMVVVLGFSRSSILQTLWAAPPQRLTRGMAVISNTVLFFQRLFAHVAGCGCFVCLPVLEWHPHRFCFDSTSLILRSSS